VETFFVRYLRKATEEAELRFFLDFFTLYFYSMFVHSYSWAFLPSFDKWKPDANEVQSVQSADFRVGSVFLHSTHIQSIMLEPEVGLHKIALISTFSPLWGGLQQCELTERAFIIGIY
jgi:hypothetical protein